VLSFLRCTPNGTPLTKVSHLSEKKSASSGGEHKIEAGKLAVNVEGEGSSEGQSALFRLYLGAYHGVARHPSTRTVNAASVTHCRRFPLLAMLLFLLLPGCGGDAGEPLPFRALSVKP